MVVQFKAVKKYLPQAEAQLPGTAEVQVGIKIEVPALDAGLLRHLVEVVEVQSKLLRQPGRGVGIGLVFLQVQLC